MAGITTYEIGEVAKGKFAAVYAIDEDDNQGLPFWIGRIHSTEASHGDEDEDDDEEGGLETTEWMVKIEEYSQTQNSKNAKGKWSGIYHPLKVHGAKKAKSSTTSAKAVYTTVPIEQIAYIFDKLSASGAMSKNVKDWVAFRCEVAARLRAFECPGFEAFNDACGHKTMPHS